MKKIILFILAFLVWSAGLMASTVQIGAGTSTTNYFPINSCYGYSYSQQIYLAGEISSAGGIAGPITKIRFYYNSGGADYSSWTNWTIYIGNTSKSVFSSSSDWISVASLTQVYSGNIPTPVPGTWMELTLSQPFNYTGGNLVVAIDENTSGYSCSAGWRSFASGSNRGMAYFNNAINPNPATPPTAIYGPNPSIAQIQFDMQSSFPSIEVNPSSLSFDYVQYGNQSVSKSFIISGTNLVENNVVISAPSGFEVSLDNSTWSGSVNILFSPPSLGNTTIYVRFNPIAENLQYSSNITIVCGVASRNVAVTGSSLLYTLYCTSTAYYNTYANIGNFNIGTLSNSSICVSSGYSNYSLTVPPPSLSRASTYYFSAGIINCGPYIHGNIIGIFIDFNRNYSFSDPGETVYLSPNYSADARTESGFITIPQDAVLGNTLMRVIVSETSVPYYIPPTSCGNYSSGETEDYIINITQAPACPPPAKPLALVYGYQANISWTEMGSADSWDLEWGPATFTPTSSPTISGLTSPNTTLTGLTPLTTYSYYVRANCGSGSFSNWTGPKTFTTTVSCPSPDSLRSSGITTTSATINWKPRGLESGWSIVYGPAGFVPGSGTGYTEILSTTSNPYYLTGLNPSVQYDFYIRAVCGVNDNSAWSSKGTFATLCDFITTFPWTEGFEGMPETGWKILPPCWSYKNVSGTSGVSSYNNNISNSGSNSISTQSQNTTWIFTPGFQLTAGVAYEFSFFMKSLYSTSQYFTLDVACGPDSTVIGMTNILSTGIICSNNGFSKVISLFIPQITGNFFFGVKSIGSSVLNSNALIFDDFNLITSLCPVPASVIVSDITNRSVQAGLTGQSGSFQFDYGPIGHIAGTGTNTGTVNTNPYIISGLASNTSYSIYARRDCGEGIFSSWQGPVTFTTLCDTVAAPFVENFNTPTLPICWSLSGPMKWNFQHVNPKPGGGASNVTDHTHGGGGNFAWVGGTGNSGLTGITMKTQAISLQGLIHPQLRFYLFNNNISFPLLPDYNQKLTVTAIAGLDSVVVYKWDYMQNSPYWQEVVISLEPFANADAVRLCFVVDRGANVSSNDDLLLDDIYIEEAPSCPKPVALDAIPYSTSATLTWNSQAPLYDVEFGLSGFIPTRYPNHPGVSNGFLVSLLNPQTSYSYYVRALCQSDSSEWAGPYTFTTPCVNTLLPLFQNFEGNTFPPTCWTKTIVYGFNNNWQLSTSASGYGNGVKSALAQLNYQGVGYISDLITPVLDTANITLPKLEFDYASANKYNLFNALNIYYSFNGGHDWILLDSMSGAPGGTLNTGGNISSNFIPLPNQWARQTLQLPKGTDRVKFRAINGGGNNLYIDNVNISQASVHDVMIDRFAFEEVVSLGFRPIIIVKNNGNEMESFPITITIGSWTSSRQVSGLLPDSSMQVTFDSCTLSVGDYTVYACTQLASDNDLSNNCITDSLRLRKLNKQVYAYCKGSEYGNTPVGPLTFNLSDPGNLTPFTGQGFQYWVPTTGAWINATWYATSFNGPYMTINQTNGVDSIITDRVHSFNAIAFNIVNNKLYGVYDHGHPELSKFHSELYEINLNNGDSSRIAFISGPTTGVFSHGNCDQCNCDLPSLKASSLAIDSRGNAFILGNAGRFGRINLETGVWTPIGFMGSSAGGEIVFDHETGNLYLIGPNFNTRKVELRLVDTTTGRAYMIGIFNGGEYLSSLVIPYTLRPHDVASYSFDFGRAADFTFVPAGTVKNLGSEAEDFNVTLTIGPWSSTKQVTNLASNMNRQIIFDSCTLPTGKYPMKLCTWLNSDMQTLNDCITDSIFISNLNKKAIVMGPIFPSRRGPVFFNLSSPGVIIDTIGSIEYPPAFHFWRGTWANGIYYGFGYVNDYPGSYQPVFFSMDTLTGIVNVINPDLGINDLQDIAYNAANNTIYGVSWYGTQTRLYSISMITGEPVFIGEGYTHLKLRLSCLAIDRGGNAYAIDNYSGYIGKVDLLTGLWTPFEKLDVTGDEYELEFDPNTGKLYLIVRRTGGDRELRLLDPELGTTQLIGKFLGKFNVNSYSGLVIPFKTYEHDVDITSIDFSRILSLGFIPKVTVMNEGTNTESFNVTLTIGNWSSTKTVSSLIPNSLKQIDFDACPLPPGDYEVSVCTYLESDMNTENDCRTRKVKLLDMNRIVYGHTFGLNELTGKWYKVSFNLGTPGILENIPPVVSRTSGAGTWANGFWYEASYNPGPIINRVFEKKDPVSGISFHIGYIDENITSIAFNVVNNTMYAIWYNYTIMNGVINTESKLYKIDTSNGNLTLIGNIAKGINSIAIDKTGRGYAANCLTSELGFIDLENGQWTLIGNIGFESEYYKYIGMAFDHETGHLYMSAEEKPSAFSSLRWVNKETGKTIRVNHFPNRNSLYAFAIPYSKAAHDAAVNRLDIGEAVDLGFTPKAIVRNEGDTTESFDVSITIGNWTSTKTTKSLLPFASQQILFDPCPLPAGNYSYSICTQLVSDENSSNDCRTGTIKILNLNKKIYTSYFNPYPGVALRGPAYFFLNNPPLITPVDYSTTDIFYGGAWANGKWYAMLRETGKNNSQFVTIDTGTGAKTVISEMDLFYSEIAYNPATNTMYSICKFGDKQYGLNILNMVTGTPSFVGRLAPGALSHFHGLAIDNSGNAFSVNTTTNQFGRINLTTGEWSPIGHMGFDASEFTSLDMEFDLETGNLYMNDMNTINPDFSKRELRLVDPVSGQSLIIHTYINGENLSGLTIPFGMPVHDVAAASFDFNEVEHLGFIPKATVQNVGENSETFQVTLTIGNWTSTKTVTALASTAFNQIVFDACTLPPGNYPVSLSTQLETDLRISNDSRLGNLKILNLNKKVFAYFKKYYSANLPLGTIYFNLSKPDSLTLLEQQEDVNQIIGGCWANGKWYATVLSVSRPYPFISIDTLTGSRNLIGDMGADISDISYNIIDNKIYGIGMNFTNNTTYSAVLYVIDTITGASTQVGSPNPGLMITSLAINKDGQAFAVELNSSQLGRIDLITGVWSPIGYIGFPYQGGNLEFDLGTGNLYMSGSNLATFGQEIRLVDIITGKTYVINMSLRWGSMRGLAIIPTVPVPTITGPLIVCDGTSGNTYNTEQGFYNYNWSVSQGGIITAGGTSTDNFITITWNGTGLQTVNVSYENSMGVQAESPAEYNVTVNPLPVVGIITSTPDDFCNGIQLTANSSASVNSYVWSGEQNTQSIFLTTANPAVTYTVNITDVNGCSGTANYTYNPQSVTSSYTLLAKSSVKLQSNNTILNGSVGVVNAMGSASIKKNFSIAGPGAFLKAQNISLQAPYTIPTIVYSPASVALPSMQYNTTSTNGLTNVTVPNGTTTTLEGNLKNVTIGTNCNVTLTGNIFGAITIGSGSSALFNQSSIDVTAITMNAGTVSANTQLKFNGDAIVRCAGSILLNSRCIVNPDNHKVIIYLGKTSGAPVAFTVAAGGNETVNASMYIPSGKISVGGDATNMTYMNGKFIAENIETLDKNVIWNWYDCTPAAAAPLITSKTSNANKEQTTKPITGLNVKAWPNPSEHQFTLNVESKSNEPVSISVYDMYGRIVYSTSGTANRQYQFGNRFVSGAYLAEVKQGVNRSIVKLIKQ